MSLPVTKKQHYYSEASEKDEKGSPVLSLNFPEKVLFPDPGLPITMIFLRLCSPISVISFPPVYQQTVIFSDFPETMVFGNTSCCRLFRDAFNNGVLSF